MPSEPGPLPEVWTPNHAVDDSELEWLLRLASSFQAYHRAGEKDVEVAACPEATALRRNAIWSSSDRL
jgi:hypothetical protein